MNSNEALDTVDDVMEVDVEGQTEPAQNVQGQDWVPDKQSGIGAAVPTRNLITKRGQPTKEKQQFHIEPKFRIVYSP